MNYIIIGAIFLNIAAAMYFYWEELSPNDIMQVLIFLNAFIIGIVCVCKGLFS